MKISSLTNNIITTKTTGWSAAAGVGIAVLSGFSKNRTIRKIHKPVSILAIIASIAHIALIEYNSYLYKKRVLK